MSRSSRSSSGNPSPASGAGLIRFYQDPSNGIKVSPVATLVLTGLLIVAVLLARIDFIQRLFNPAGG